MRLNTWMNSGIAAGLSIAISLGAGMTQAADYKLTISSWTPMSAAMNAIMWPELTKRIEEATDGRVTAEIKLNLAPPPAQFDIVQDGAADMSWIFHGYNPGQFVTTKLAELPGFEASSENLSVAYWRTYEKYLSKANEHDGVKVVGLMVHGPGQINTSNPVSSLSEAKGLKIRVGGGVASMAAEHIGAVGMNVPSPKLYETLASHVADGTLSPIESRKSFNLVEVAPYVYEMPGGFYRGSFAIIMNEDTFEAFPADIQKALEGVLGEATSRLGGEMWDQIDKAGREYTQQTEGNVITLASEADQASWKEMRSEIVESVLAEIDKNGVDSKVAYEYMTEQLNK
tara:strand:- start:1976 stop:3001 length:1026 start_codon:yes stop_codon:yes gene_type:complete